MYKIMLNADMIRLNDMAKRLGVSTKTLQRWDKEGILVAKRNPNNRRYYTEDQYLEYIGKSNNNDYRKIVAYTRVSNNNQKEDLKNQITFIRNYVNAKFSFYNKIYSRTESIPTKNWKKNCR